MIGVSTQHEARHIRTTSEVDVARSASGVYDTAA
jgi:hypothetical protein